MMKAQPVAGTLSTIAITRFIISTRTWKRVWGDVELRWITYQTRIPPDVLRVPEIESGKYPWSR